MAALESKTAGRALAAIVLLLMLPMLLIGYFYYAAASVEITALAKEQAGSKLLQSVYPVLMATDEQKVTMQLQLIKNAEETSELRGHKSFADHWFEDSASHPEMTPDQIDASSKEDAAAYVSEIAAISGLSLDSDLSSFYLIDSTVLTLPRQIKDVQLLGIMMRSLATDPRNLQSKVADIAQLQGRIRAASDRFAESLARSVEFGGESENIAKVKAADARLTARIRDISRLISNSHGNLSSQDYFKFAGAGNTIAAIKQDAWAISAAAFAELDHKLFVRLHAAKNKLNALTLLGFSTAALGLGLAIQMFRKTLTKLDQVDAARLAAVHAEQDAVRINGEIASLNRNLAEKIKELEQAQNEIVKKGRMEQLGQLTATIAHELRNPLGSVRTSAYLINRKVGGKGLGVDEQISRIEKGVVRCDNIITQLLDFSRTKQIAAKPVNLDNWLAGVVTEEANKLPANIQIDCVLGLSDRDVPFDPARMQRAIINLLSNAVEAMTNKDNPATAANTHPKLSISTFVIGESVAIRVKDNGPGIAPDIISKIREPLFTTKSFGTGLGIPAIEQIAVQHGGKLEISSQPGAGAEFTIYLPSQLTSADEDQATQPIAVAS